MSVVKAVFKKNLASFFGNPAGYVFIILFVGMTAWFAFVTEDFFANNQANLNPLTVRMPWLLMIFVASVTMATWAEEKKLGTDELLFTLPCGDMPVVLGKFFASLAVFTAALAFTLSHVFILSRLGDPDLGLLFSTYLGYWLVGAAFIATGMFASSLTHNLTVGFILGALFCAIFAFSHVVGVLLPGRLGSGINELAAVTHLESFARGVVSLKDVFYFLSIVAVMLFLNALVLSKRRWPGGKVDTKENPKIHAAVQIIAVVIIAVSANVLVGRFGGRVDVTEEGLSSLSGETRQILTDIPRDRPVYIQAWISEEVPPFYSTTRDTLVHLLKEYDELGGDAVRVQIFQPERYSQEARDAKDRFSITPQNVPVRDGTESTFEPFFAGAAFICGIEEEVIPFFQPGIRVEYELTRTIRVVSKAERPKVGILENELKLLGGFDFETYQQAPRWQIVQELQKQYEVDSIRADSEVPDDVNVIVGALPSLLTDEKLANVISAIKTGKPALLFVDPLPSISVTLSPDLPRPSPRSNPMMGRQPPGEPKANMQELMNLLGVRWSNNLIVWESTNPHPEYRYLSPEFVFVTDGESGANGEGRFNASDATTSGLQEILALFPGSLRKGMAPQGADLTFEPLITTSVNTTGVINWNQIVGQSFFGPQVAPLDALKRFPRRVSPQSYVLAARIRGEIPIEEKDSAPAPKSAEDEQDTAMKGEGEAAGETATAEGASESEASPEEPKTAKIDVILVADLDMISDIFFQLRQSKMLNLDNVTFVLNCVDALAGDESYIELRKRRRIFRTLTTIEKLETRFREQKLQEEQEAETVAQQKLAAAQAGFDEKVGAIEERTDLDPRAKEVMIASLKQREEAKLTAKKQAIEDEQQKRIDDAYFAMRQQIGRIHSNRKFLAVTVPILLPLLIGILVFFMRRSKENIGVAKSRLVGD